MEGSAGWLRREGGHCAPKGRDSDPSSKANLGEDEEQKETTGSHGLGRAPQVSQPVSPVSESHLRCR